MHEAEGDPHSPANAEEGVGTRHKAGMTAQGQLVGGVGQQGPQDPVPEAKENISDTKGRERAATDGAGQRCECRGRRDDDGAEGQA